MSAYRSALMLARVRCMQFIAFLFVCSYHKRGLIPAIKLALYHTLFSIYFLVYINSIYSCPCFKIISSLRWRPVNL